MALTGKATRWHHLHPQTSIGPIKLADFVAMAEGDLLVGDAVRKDRDGVKPGTVNDPINPAYREWVDRQARKGVK